MANVNIEFQGDFQYLKYEFTPRLRALIKNVHTVMNSYNAAFFERCKGLPYIPFRIKCFRYLELAPQKKIGYFWENQSN